MGGSDQWERASFQACAITVREMIDRGGIPGVTPSAAFVLCRMLEMAASDPDQLPVGSRHELRNVVSALGAGPARPDPERDQVDVEPLALASMPGRSGRVPASPPATSGYGDRMREVFLGELADLGEQLSQMAALTTIAITRATRALVEADLTLAEAVISQDAAIHERARRCEDRACVVLATQAPVARDLRLVVTTIKIAEKLERMGDLARHIAELARLRHPASALPPDLAARFSLIGRLATQASRRVENTLAEPTGDCLPAQDRADDAIDELQDAILDQLRAADPPYPMQAVVDVTLLARYFERFADQAVGVTKNLDYLVTGKMPV